MCEPCYEKHHAMSHNTASINHAHMDITSAINQTVRKQ